MTAPGNGRRRARGDAPGPPDPCLLPTCACCNAWTAGLELLRAHARRHLAGEARVAPCFAECLICAEVAWQGDPRLDPAQAAAQAAAVDVALGARAASLGIDPHAYLDPVRMKELEELLGPDAPGWPRAK